MRSVLRAATRREVLPLFEKHHIYAGLSKSLTYCFCLEVDSEIIAAFAWQPPPPGAARSVCQEAPHAVLSLSRMVATPAAERQHLSQSEGRHISKPLKRQMCSMIDRGRWPVLVTYSDEGCDHDGYTYRCSGWVATKRNLRQQFVDTEGVRTSTYANGRHDASRLTSIGSHYCQRWEHWACDRGTAATWLAANGWKRVEVPGKRWKSGAQAFTFRKT